MIVLQVSVECSPQGRHIMKTFIGIVEYGMEDELQFYFSD